MREPLIRHQIIEYQPNEPFYAANSMAKNANDLYVRHSHWHEELEIAYVLQGHYRHYIDGECIQAEPGRLIVTNCESIHRIDACTEAVDDPETPTTIVLVVHNRFIEENFPEYKNFRFTNRKTQTRPEVRDIMLHFSEYAKKQEHLPNEHLYMRGLLLQLLYFLYQEGTVSRNDSASVKRQEQIQPLKEILQYVEHHYREPITQAEVAKEFYFRPQYFSYYFKKCTGTTFMEHLTNYRLRQAKQELLHTHKRISDIARDNGFRDDRSFIRAFKKVCQVTPTQFKKKTAETSY